MRTRAVSALLTLWLAGAGAWAQIPTSNVLFRVLRIRSTDATGSAFTIEVDGKLRAIHVSPVEALRHDR